MRQRRLRAVQAVVTAVLWHMVRPRLDRWGATDEEVASHLPGDEFVAEPASQATRAITIDAPAESVWPWIVQIGADRGGFYSYDWLENLFGLGIHSTDRIAPEWQAREVGDLVRAASNSDGGWLVVEVRPQEALVLKMVDPTTGQVAQRDMGWRWEFAWTFVIRDAGSSRIRLLVRERTGFGSPLMRIAIAPIGLVSFVMTEKMLRGIKVRAEARSTLGGRADAFLPDRKPREAM